MTQSIVLRAPPAVTSRVPFVVTVDVRPVSPGRRVTVSLTQKRGEDAATPLDSIELTHARGDTVFASFQVTLRERGSALLLATAHDDAGGRFQPDCVAIEVL